MAKKLEVWKTDQGEYFESEAEARHAEALAKIQNTLDAIIMRVSSLSDDEEFEHTLLAPELLSNIMENPDHWLSAIAELSSRRPGHHGCNHLDEETG